jgi:hypothetical protein
MLCDIEIFSCSGIISELPIEFRIGQCEPLSIIPDNAYIGWVPVICVLKEHEVFKVSRYIELSCIAEVCPDFSSFLCGF